MRREECLTGPSVDVDGKIRENRIRSIYEGTNLKFTNLNRIIDEARDCEDEAEDFMDVYGGKIVQKWKQGQNAWVLLHTHIPIFSTNYISMVRKWLKTEMMHLNFNFSAVLYGLYCIQMCLTMRCSMTRSGGSSPPTAWRGFSSGHAETTSKRWKFNAKVA